jgi:hypothetical protein
VASQVYRDGGAPLFWRPPQITESKELQIRNAKWIHNAFKP